MLLTATTSSSSSQPDTDLEESVEADPDLKFQFVLFQDDNLNLADNLNFDLFFI